VLALLLFPALAHAADLFPRGPGYYYHPFKLLLVVLVYLAWVRTCWWVNADAAQMDQPRERWNLTLLGCGLAGLFFFWVLPWFFVGFLALLVMYLTPALAYVSIRNEKATYEQKVLTPRHLQELANRWLHLGLSKTEEPKERAIPLRFLGKNAGGRGADPKRISRAEESRGYRAALEIVHEAILMRATDIHLEPGKNEVSVRFRVDGILHTATPFSRSMGDSVINIFKVLAALDITEKRKPQDGSFSAEVMESGDEVRERRKRARDQEEEEAPLGAPERSAAPQKRVVDFRVATAGSVAGEKMVMRILDPSRQVAGLEQIGMREAMVEQIRRIVSSPHGLLLVCGPTGAGKSTTLYACLAEIDRYTRNVITLENPVEYTIENVTQIEVNPRAGKTFASELRSILRQDPDVIYVGEIRDAETAEIACQAAQTGHMVFTTIHANDTVTALGRLIDLKVPPFLVGNAITAILGQRLVRLLCPKCKQRYKPNAELLRKANLPADRIKFFYRPPEAPEDEEEHVPCEYCGGTGYRGRTGIFELLVLTDAMRDMIRENPNLTALKQEAVKNGMKYLHEDGLRLVIEGETSIQELLRVCK
jgi:type II secretory ATPase GspE/PulE/Tfp pilus assembly ATPase PilB-like protein